MPVPIAGAGLFLSNLRPLELFPARAVLCSLVPATFRWSFYGGAALAFILGVWLVKLWGSEHQIELHTNHLLRSIESRDWKKFSSFLAPDYQDQWAQDRTTVMERARQVFGYLRGIELKPIDPGTTSSGAAGSWQARIELTGASNSELASLVRERLTRLKAPFQLEWRRQSWKPWDWQLVRVSNADLELPAGNEFMP